MKKIFLLIVLLCFYESINAQIGISATNTPPNASAMLDVSSTVKGILVPRMTTFQKNAIQNPVEGLMVYDTDVKQFSYAIAGTTGGIIYWVNFGNTVPAQSNWNSNGDDIYNANVGNVIINNIGFASSAKLEVQSNTATAMKITQVGPYEGLKIESGTSNNTNPVLNVSNSTSAYGGYFRSSNATARGLYSLLDDATNSHDAIEGITFGNGNGGSFNSISGTAGYFTSASGKALVTGNGNVGIGNASPTNKLSVTGNADFSGNVGIGNVSPTNKLSVIGNADVSGNLGIGMTGSTMAKFSVSSDAISGTTNGIFGQGQAGISLQQNYPTIGFNQYRDYSNANTSKYMANGFAAVNYLNLATGEVIWESFPVGSGNANTLASGTRSLKLY